MSGPETPVLVEAADGVLTIRLNRPAALNALNDELGRALAAALDQAADPGVRCVLLTGAGRAFSSGADLKGTDGPRLPGGAPDLERALREVFNRPVRQLRDLPKPVVAAINGPAVGIAASYALACDLVLAARSAYLMLPFTALGLVPDGGASCLIPARAGIGRFNRLALGAQPLPAETALTLGLIDRVVEDDALPDAAETLARTLAEGSTSAFAACKQLINAGPLAGLDGALALEAELQGRQSRTDAFARALAAFRARAAGDVR